jgi:predicted outer membrane repeat protein
MKTKDFFSGVLGVVLALGLLVVGCASAPDLTGVTTYYVNAAGNDKNSGISEDKAFKTLTYAVTVASTSTVKKITVLGKLNEMVKISNCGKTEILITGKQNANEAEQAVLTGKDFVFNIKGDSKIKLEHLQLTQSINAIEIREKADVTIGAGVKIYGNSANSGPGVWILDGTLLLEGDAQISDNTATNGGAIACTNGGIIIIKDNVRISNNKTTLHGGAFDIRDSSLLIQDNVQIDGNSAPYGGALTIVDGSKVTMKGQSAIINNISTGVKSTDGGGGAVFLDSGSLTMHDNSKIANNNASYGGGVFVLNGILTMENNASIENNTTPTTGTGNRGGGVLLSHDGSPKLIMRDNSIITRNSSADGGGVFNEFGEIVQEGGKVVDNKATVGKADIAELGE